MRNCDVSIVVPLFNEEESFETLISRLNNVIRNATFSIEIVLVDDGSSDSTPLKMVQISEEDTHFKSVFLSRNFGHQAAVSAGLTKCSADKAVMIIDGDLQDPPELVYNFYEKFNEGFDVVYGIRKKRKEGFFKRASYYLYYRLQRRLTQNYIPIDSGDFGLMSRRVVDLIIQMPEESRYLRGMRSWLGFKQCGFEYERDERKLGTSKYSLRKLIRLAYSGIFNFSELPIKFITSLGLTAIVTSLIYLIYTIIFKLIYNGVPIGFTGLLMAIILFGGVQLVSLGIIGEYIVRIFFQVKNRPLFIIKTVLNESEKIDLNE